MKFEKPLLQGIPLLISGESTLPVSNYKNVIRVK
jgi:hypothetical protein